MSEERKVRPLVAFLKVSATRDILWSKGAPVQPKAKQQGEEEASK